ncbi:MAG: leucyl/phenylalanyl-tRNA--protein transferase [Bacteroidetes bacterium]|nr:leucyl/phenylalanyl-tRNA--protein transferase [Bacteroidota bacterium]
MNDIFRFDSDGVQYIQSERLLEGYRRGIFPMSDEDDGEIYWFSPDTRGIIPLNGLKISRSLRQTLKKKKFTVRINTAFEEVMRNCAKRPSVWISESIIRSYVRLFETGYAHSVECWKDTSLVGGLYGVAIGGAFFGESMFSRERDASKVALVHLVQRLNERNFILLDTQYTTPHLISLGCIEISKREYLQKLDEAIRLNCTFL